MKNSRSNSWHSYKLLGFLGGFAGVIIGLQATPMDGSSKVDGTIKIDGSSTVYPISKDVAKDFSASNPTIKVETKMMMNWSRELEKIPMLWATLVLPTMKLTPRI